MAGGTDTAARASGHRGASALRLATLGAVLLVLSCSDEPTAPPQDDPMDPPEALRVEVPEDAVVSGQAFPLTVEALDEEGGRDAAWVGTVTLSASAGTVSPGSVELVDGVATVQATLSNAGAVMLTAAVGGGGAGVSVDAALFVLSAQEAVRLVVEPSSFLLTDAGEEAELRARAYDAAGQESVLPDGLTWRSLDAAAIEVETAGGGAPAGTGVARAVAGSGSAQVVVETGALTSAPALGLVATPAAGAVLIDDAQVVGGIEAVDPDAPFVPGFQYRVRLVGSADVAVGELVIGSGEAPIAGRVVDVQPDGAENVVTLELVSLADLFSDLVIDETLPLVDAEDAPGARFGLAPAADARAGAGLSGLRSPARATEFEVGPFACEASGSVPGLALGEPDYDITPHLDLQLVYDGGLRVLTVKGEVEATFEYGPRLNAVFTGKVDCTRVVRTLVLPVGGFLSLIVGAQVPVGIGVDLDAKLEIAQVGFDVDASASASVTLGLTCPAAGPCTGLSEADGSADASFEFVAPDPTEQFKLKLGAHGYAFARLTLGSPLKSDWQWKAFVAKAGLEQIVDLAAAKIQAEDTAYASGFWLVAKAEAGPDEDLSKAVEWLNERFGLDLDVNAAKYEKADTLARSPTGTFEITPETVEPGSDLALGEMATFKATLEDVTYLGAESVDKVEFFWWKEAEDENGEGTGQLSLEPGRPSCTEVQGGSGKTDFECQTDFLDEHRGTQTFYAFTHAELFGVPLPVPLEVAANAVDSVAVGGCIGIPGFEDFSGELYALRDTTSDGSGSEYTSSADPLTFGDVGATMSATSEEDESNTPRFSISASAQDALCVQATDTTTMGDTVYVRIHATGQLGRNPANNIGGISSSNAQLNASGVFRIWSDGGQEATAIDEEIVVPLPLGQWRFLSAAVYAAAGSILGYPHSASARLTYTIVRIEDDSGTELQGVSLRTSSGFDYGLGDG